MDKSGVLYTYGGNFRALRILIAAGYSGVDVSIDSKFTFGCTNKSAEFLAKFPGGKVPAYSTKDGFQLSETDAITRYVASDDFKGGKCLKGQAKIDQWMSFAQSELYPAVCGWLYPNLSIMAFNKEQVAKAKAEVERTMKLLDDHLLTRTYIIREAVTLADICVFTTLVDIYKHLFDAESKAAFVNVNRWFDTILNQPIVKKALESYKYGFSYCTVPAKFDPVKFKEIGSAGGPGGPKKDEKKKEEKPKAKKEEKPKAKKEEEPEEMDEAEAALALEPKSKDPLDALPKGEWVMDDFKRFYSNNDVDKSLPYFWEKFDSQNYSIWLGEYQYNHELTKIFMSSNLIGGMFQRLDKLRKNAFASMCLFGEDNNSSISGVWVWRGQELAFPLSPDWQIDYETYTWTKLDPQSADTKKMVEEYFAWTGADKEGRKFNQGKIFK